MCLNRISHKGLCALLFILGLGLSTTGNAWHGGYHGGGYYRGGGYYHGHGYYGHGYYGRGYYGNSGWGWGGSPMIVGGYLGLAHPYSCVRERICYRDGHCALQRFCN